MKNKLKNIIKYIGIGITSGLTIITPTKAQSTEYNKPTTEIIQEGDNIIIPEHKLTEFIKNNKQEKNNKITKKTLEEFIKDGYITNVLTKEPIQGIETKLVTYTPFPTDTIGPVTTNSQGYYTFTITGINEQKETKNIGTIEYINGTAKITVNNYKKIKITTYDIQGKEITRTTEKEINGTENINLKLPIGETITKIEIDNKTYTNIHINDGKNHYVKKGKNKEQIIEEQYKKLNKTQTLIGLINLQSPNNQYHRYYAVVDYDGVITGNKRFDINLIPRIPLENPIIDPGYTTIPYINTIRDLMWYSSRIEDEWDNRLAGKTLYPIKIYIDSSNAPTGGITSARKIIQYFQDSLDIHPDSLIQETPINIEPNFNNGFSAMKIIWTDSTQTNRLNSLLTFIFSSSHETFIGGKIYIDTNKVTTEENMEKYIARLIQLYITGGVYPINNQNYLAYTTGNRIGPTKRPNNDEKKWIKIERYHKPYYMNRVYP
ncbi:Hypothetical protein IALB_1224 [Ignavibacterium album JCM 16511]|uniref:Uncharacterized protein n=1 Tax=Ignavibacterium album (strain DSM 19864 / JCM 16511 / NBRC 101810 / Mat9-16) TaxID=945713 RepID=I0AIX8_IGNAJ|nr:hypothetical protein [Ignavibacterium album]AFH48935.1 Hypothetical protein IALB_1224 [Ignavibacterium album JCM 16511]